MSDELHTQGTVNIAHTRDGRDLFYQELSRPEGRIAPIVVFESGLAASRSFWGLVQPRVAQCARAVVYDRSGLGRSPPDSKPRTIERMAADLNDLLDHLGAGPFVLAAHSGGGPIVRAATAVCPERIAGLVLVDVTDETCSGIFEKSSGYMMKAAHAASWLLARLGLLEICYRKSIAPLPPDVRHDLKCEGFTPAAMRTRLSEFVGLSTAMEIFRDRPPFLPDIPVTVISGALAGLGMNKFRKAVTAAHRHRAGQLPQGRHVVAERSGHAVVLTEPELVADEIRRIVVRSDLQLSRSPRCDVPR